jgi:hypothetical protein
MVAEVAVPDMIKTVKDSCPGCYILDAGEPFVKKIRRLNFVSHVMMSHIRDKKSSRMKLACIVSAPPFRNSQYKPSIKPTIGICAYLHNPPNPLISKPVFKEQYQFP